MTFSMPRPVTRWWKPVGFEEPPLEEIIYQRWNLPKKSAKTCCMVSTCFNLSIWSCLHGDLRISIPCFTCFLWESDTPDSETRKRMKREVPILLRVRGTMDRAKEAPSDMPMTEMRLSSTQTRLPWRFWHFKRRYAERTGKGLPWCHFFTKIHPKKQTLDILSDPHPLPHIQWTAKITVAQPLLKLQSFLWCHMVPHIWARNPPEEHWNLWFSIGSAIITPGSHHILVCNGYLTSFRMTQNLQTSERWGMNCSLGFNPKIIFQTFPNPGCLGLVIQF